MTWYEAVSEALLLVTLLAVTWQARGTARQARVTSSVAAFSAMHETFDRVHRVLGMCIEHPQLRALMEPDPPPTGNAEELARALTFVEMWADSPGAWPGDPA